MNFTKEYYFNSLNENDVLPLEVNNLIAEYSRDIIPREIYVLLITGITGIKEKYVSDDMINDIIPIVPEFFNIGKEGLILYTTSVQLTKEQLIVYRRTHDTINIICKKIYNILDIRRNYFNVVDERNDKLNEALYWFAHNIYEYI